MNDLIATVSDRGYLLPLPHGIAVTALYTTLCFQGRWMAGRTFGLGVYGTWRVTWMPKVHP